MCTNTNTKQKPQTKPYSNVLNTKTKIETKTNHKTQKKTWSNVQAGWGVTFRRLGCSRRLLHLLRALLLM